MTLTPVSNELTRVTRTAVQALVAFLVNLGLMKLGYDPEVVFGAVFEFLGFTEDQVLDEITNLVFLAVMPATTWLVALLEQKVHPLFGYLNGPRRTVEYSSVGDGDGDGAEAGIE